MHVHTSVCTAKIKHVHSIPATTVIVHRVYVPVVRADLGGFQFADNAEAGRSVKLFVRLVNSLVVVVSPQLNRSVGHQFVVPGGISDFVVETREVAEEREDFFAVCGTGPVRYAVVEFEGTLARREGSRLNP